MKASQDLKSCKFCSNKFWMPEETPLFDNIDFSKCKPDCYSGLMATILDSNRLRILAMSDTFQTWVEDVEIPIKYCPMCGRKLSEEVNDLD